MKNPIFSFIKTLPLSVQRNLDQKLFLQNSLQNCTITWFPLLRKRYFLNVEYPLPLFLPLKSLISLAYDCIYFTSVFSFGTSASKPFCKLYVH